MTKYQFRESDIYLPGTDVPVNLLGIEEPEILHVIEAELLERAYVQAVEDLSPHTRFDEAYFRSLHRNAFESLYAWAGEYRDVDMAKGESMFCRGAYVPERPRASSASWLKRTFYVKPRTGLTSASPSGWAGTRAN